MPPEARFRKSSKVVAFHSFVCEGPSGHEGRFFRLEGAPRAQKGPSFVATRRGQDDSGALDSDKLLGPLLNAAGEHGLAPRSLSLRHDILPSYPRDKASGGCQPFG